MGFSEPHKVLMAMALYLLLFEGEADKGKLQLAAAEGALLNTACCCCLGSEGANQAGSTGLRKPHTDPTAPCHAEWHRIRTTSCAKALLVPSWPCGGCALLVQGTRVTHARPILKTVLSMPRDAGESPLLGSPAHPKPFLKPHNFTIGLVGADTLTGAPFPERSSKTFAVTSL